MIAAETFIRMLQDAGFGLFSGVPCSYLTPLIDTVIDSPQIHYIPAANEGDAVAVGCGAELAGCHAVVMFQNSGLGNAVSPLTSLTSTFKLPVLVITTWRGQPGGPADEPQHATMGEITPAMLELMGIPWEPFPQEDHEVAAAIDRATAHMRSAGTPYALLMSKAAVPRRTARQPQPHVAQSAAPLAQPLGKTASSPPSAGRAASGSASQPHDQDEVLRTIQAAVGPCDAVLATTGFTGRALYAAEDLPNQFYMVGSMGCVSSLGLGLACVRPERRVIVIDGDGALLMRMGALATIGHQAPRNLVHIVLDNGVHDSTGAQPTVSSSMNLVQLARACGYPRAVQACSLEALQELLREPPQQLTFIAVQTKAREDRQLPRPVITPAEVAQRFQCWLQAAACA